MKNNKSRRNISNRLKYPVMIDGFVEYVGIPSDYILRDRLCLNNDDVFKIRLAYGVYQDTVRCVLSEKLARLDGLPVGRVRNLRRPCENEAVVY